MSDVPNNAILQLKLSIESPSLRYALQSASRSVAFAVDIPFPLLKGWYDFFKSGVITEEHSNNVLAGINSYCDLFELAIPGNIFAIRRSADVRDEISESLRKRASSVKALYSRTKGRKRAALDGETKRFHLFEGHVLSVAELKQESERLQDEREEWKRKYDNLKEEMGKLHQEMMEEIMKKEKIIEEQQRTNEELMKYIKELENVQQLGGLENKGKDVADVKKKSRTLKTFMSRAQTALWFSKSFGLELESLLVRERKTETVHVLQISTPQQQLGNCTDLTGFDALSDADKAKVEQTLFLLDKYGVGDSFFHELSMSNCAGLPRSYLIKQRRDDLRYSWRLT